MVDIIQQQSFMANDFRMDIYTLELDAATNQLAKLRARRWVRTEFPAARPINVTLLGADRQGKAQTVISDFVPDTFKRNEFTVEVGIRR